jgi:hypothetical protein
VTPHCLIIICGRYTHPLLIVLFCLRVQALYHGVRWVIVLVWTCFVFLHTMRFAFTILATVKVFGKGTTKTVFGYYNSLIDYMEYSPVSRACLPHGGNSPISAIFILPPVLDVLLLVLTVIKTYQNVVVIKEGFGSSIVCLTSPPAASELTLCSSCLHCSEMGSSESFS